jgi:hypothetical protein
MSIIQDPREVVSDAHARYFGAELQNDTLVPAQAPTWQGGLNFEHWLQQSEFARYAPREQA